MTKVVLRVRGEKENIHDLAFSPDGARLGRPNGCAARASRSARAFRTCSGVRPWGMDCGPPPLPRTGRAVQRNGSLADLQTETLRSLSQPAPAGRPVNQSAPVAG